jgi:starch phosphorylase
VNGVAKRHGEVSRQLFGEHPIDAITNGVHAATWVGPSFAALYDKHIPGWREDNFSLRYAMSIPGDDIWRAHRTAKRRLVDFVNRETNAGLDVDFFTLGFGRRATAYKRADLILTDLDRLRRMSRDSGRIQLVFAGKAHPHDGPGKELIRSLFRSIGALRPDVRAAYLPNYDMDLCGRMTAGVDCWLNTPQPPMEASGTSGMKAALNGVPSLSTLDGWWLEGWIEGVTGWAVESPTSGPPDNHTEADALYTKLETVILPLFYGNRSRFVDVMRHAIAINGSFFHTQRMIRHYVTRAYFA